MYTKYQVSLTYSIVHLRKEMLFEKKTNDVVSSIKFCCICIFLPSVFDTNDDDVLLLFASNADTTAVHATLKYDYLN